MGFSCFYGAEKVLKKSWILILSFEWEPCFYKSNPKQLDRWRDSSIPCRRMPCGRIPSRWMPNRLSPIRIHRVCHLVMHNLSCNYARVRCRCAEFTKSHSDTVHRSLWPSVADLCGLRRPSHHVNNLVEHNFSSLRTTLMRKREDKVKMKTRSLRWVYSSMTSTSPTRWLCIKWKLAAIVGDISYDVTRWQKIK